MLGEAVGVLNVGCHTYCCWKGVFDSVGNTVEDGVVSMVVPASISGLGAVIENMQERLILLAEGANRVVSLLPKVQVHMVRKNIHCCIACSTLVQYCNKLKYLFIAWGLLQLITNM